MRLDTASARYSRSLGTASALAYSMTGTDTVMPWLPLPELMTTAQLAAAHPGVGTGGRLGNARLRTSPP